MARYDDGTSKINPNDRVMYLRASFERYTGVPALRDKVASIADAVEKLKAYEKVHPSVLYATKSAIIFVGGMKVAEVFIKPRDTYVKQLDPITGNLTEEVLFKLSDYQVWQKAQEARKSVLTLVNAEREELLRARRDEIIDKLLEMANEEFVRKYDAVMFDFSSLKTQHHAEEVDSFWFKMSIHDPSSTWGTYINIAFDRHYTRGPGFRVSPRFQLNIERSSADRLRAVAKMIEAYAEVSDIIEWVRNLPEVPSTEQLLDARMQARSEEKEEPACAAG